MLCSIDGNIANDDPSHAPSVEQVVFAVFHQWNPSWFSTFELNPINWKKGHSRWLIDFNGSNFWSVQRLEHYLVTVTSKSPPSFFATSTRWHDNISFEWRWFSFWIVFTVTRVRIWTWVGIPSAKMRKGYPYPSTFIISWRRFTSIPENNRLGTSIFDWSSEWIHTSY